MFSYQEINFYIDDQGNVIPASIIARESEKESFRLAGVVVEQEAIRGIASAPEPHSKQQLALWMYPTLALSGAFLLGFTALNRAPVPAATPTALQPSPVVSNAQMAATALPTTPISYTAVLQKARQFAQRATTFVKSAQSVDDWKLVANQWKRAIALLKSVPDDSAEYAIAQQKVREYQQSLNVALQRANQPIVDVMPTTRFTLSSGLSCSEVASSPDASSVELTNVNFDAADGKGQPAHLIGCITNRTNQTITNVAILYRGTSMTDSSLFQAANATIHVDRIDPGQTVPFRSDFALNPTVDRVSIELINWLTLDSNESQNSPIALNISRE
ncbi:MAG TPA: hypothetical protein V6C78_06665 [Crinalium sp.]